MDDPLPDDGLQCFGAGFDGFPKRLPDDCVEYVIHVIDQKLDSMAAVRCTLNEMLKAVSELKKKKYLNDYIWQRDTFDLVLHPKLHLSKADDVSRFASTKSPPYLRGRTNFGDSVADEWLIVYLLRELSKQFLDAWIRIYDTDGEFLLIEAANSLPKWLSPETAEDRVWLNDGHLKIIPLEGDAPNQNMSLEDALSTIKRTPEKLLVDEKIEKEAFYRLREYPSAISSSLHHAPISIPRRLAYILHRNPAYISPAVESFYLRDPVSLKPLATKDTATLSFPPEDFAIVSVRFTKVGYAQLRSQVFDPPPAWTAVIPRMKDEKVAMGMKLTCGFEMLVADPQNQDSRNVREIKLLLEDIETGDEKLPDDAELATWPKTQDDEKWLDIDYNDFEKELSGKAGGNKGGAGDGFGDQGAQENLRKMVSRFEDFLEDDEAGAEGIDDMDDDDEEVADSDEDAEDKPLDEADMKKNGTHPDTEDAWFDDAMKDVRFMGDDQKAESGLLDEARKLALQDDEDATDIDEDEEMRKVIELMEKELKDHGALNLNADTKSKGKGKAPAVKPVDKPTFGPERPPNLQVKKKGVHFEGEEEEADEEIGPGDGELSSDDEEYNDVDLGLAKNMLESFKGQAGMAGPAGNIMRALGVGMPRDEGEEEEGE
ncbi:hypothetical protein CLAFUW4_13204 [Fulvia fulva]|uniref:SGT1-domain-containing protein n=1 Tax=Passalora fulva TaxID=5499 RepID=A0A9Q8PKB5_PASFU|nr:uncharacterized protein CLAFUR5_13060 [Fulvia fulva]KAK4611929.1 hypothetical protein CLAFUR4_13209 [Fulvia fulva]KAK4612913.1 hypothetical protein CLAFUR0_13213 [Fulvia fulva]UJO24075.1 hypothetical protein CLAFUR5_13060 [Fulvia fulva]WPV21521.1 hypothetical protein CLAFUW4_13204 [Fulvia fulva]WPV35810.1 hypothetical protein CLAFUW7_13212 [Fulvia fulva]